MISEGSQKFVVTSPKIRASQVVVNLPNWRGGVVLTNQIIISHYHLRIKHHHLQ